MNPAVVFDMDGVLISSEELWDAVRADLVREAGGRWLPGAHEAMMGMSTPEWTGYMHQELAVPLRPPEIERAVVARLIARYREAPPFIPGAPEAVRELAARGVPLAVASSSTRGLIAAVLEQAGIADAFRATVSSEEVARGKPAPDVYLEALRRLGAPAAGALAVEDSGPGIRSAAAAGMRVVVVPNPHYPPPQDDLALAWRVLESIEALPGLVAGA
ncbi:HAD family hydrolase [Miltoncostaea marina]|uniref:HAD family hydrolase n=1 Tax=Miltoncostaea marina TaxID=2843215 RepID=UPI001C3DB0F1|nr:HAD family phosphatase [Miltoncostaea marina]